MLRVKEEELDCTPDGLTCLWQEEPFTGVSYDLTPDQHLWSELEYLNGLQTGIGREYYPSGQMKTETTYQNGSKHGQEREWFENGQLCRQADYEHAILLRERIWNMYNNLERDYVISEQQPNYSLLLLLRERKV